MNTILGCVLVSVFTLFIGYLGGWQQAHTTVAAECTKLGSFYVGNRVFKCTEVTNKE